MRRLLAEGALGERDAGAVHQHLKAAEFLERALDRRLAVGFRSDVGLDEARTDFPGELFADVCLHVGDDHLAAVVRRHASRRGAEAGCAAGDEEYAVLDLHRNVRLGIR